MEFIWWNSYNLENISAKSFYTIQSMKISPLKINPLYSNTSYLLNGCYDDEYT